MLAGIHAAVWRGGLHFLSRDVGLPRAYPKVRLREIAHIQGMLVGGTSDTQYQNYIMMVESRKESMNDRRPALGKSGSLLFLRLSDRVPTILVSERVPAMIKVPGPC